MGFPRRTSGEMPARRVEVGIDSKNIWTWRKLSAHRSRYE